MTEIKRSLLNLIQHEFPLEPKPFLTLGIRLGISEKKCIDILKQLVDDGILRAIRMVISWNKIGFSTVLVGMKVDPEKIDTVALAISQREEVTHNYIRKGHFNLWFTLIYSIPEQKDKFFDSIRAMNGVDDLREFKAEKTYKIGLVLDV